MLWAGAGLPEAEYCPLGEGASGAGPDCPDAAAMHSKTKDKTREQKVGKRKVRFIFQERWPSRATAYYIDSPAGDQQVPGERFDSGYLGRR